MEQLITLDNKKIALHGRTHFDNTLLGLPWSNSGFTFCFKGSGIVISFAEYKDTQPAYVKIYLNGRAQTHSVVNGSEKIVLGNLSNKRYTVTLLRITEGESSLRIKDILIKGTNCALLPYECVQKPKIEFLGDSITCGYGNMAEPTVHCYNTYDQDSTLAFPVLACKELNAELRTISISGKGVVKNYSGDTVFTIPRFFEYTEREKCDEWDFSLWQPDIVVINAGTNDTAAGVTVEEFQKGAYDFLTLVRSKYKNAHIIYFFGFMSRKMCPAIEKAVEAFSKHDGKVYYLDVESMIGKPGEAGGNGHPNLKAHKRAAGVLTAFIRRKNLLPSKLI